MQMNIFLKRVLLLDAASCVGMGLGLVAGAAMLAGPLGLPAALLSGAALSLLPIGLFMAFVLAQAAFVTALACLEYAGLRRAGAAVA